MKELKATKKKKRVKKSGNNESPQRHGALREEVQWLCDLCVSVVTFLFPGESLPA